MRHIEKGSAPDVLVKEGKAFQEAAVRFASNPKDISYFAKDFEKYAVYVKTNNGKIFDHYASGLFTKYSYYSDPAVKRQLIAEHAGKCAFCESFIMDTDVGDVEHFRPKAEVKTADLEDSRIERSVEDHSGYFWLSAAWENLFLSCKQCNQAYKRNFFDLNPYQTRRKTYIHPDIIEDPLLLCPALEDTELRRLIRFDPSNAEAMLNPERIFGKLDNRAHHLLQIPRTIAIVGLNRPRLLEARANHLVKLRAFFVLVASAGGLDPAHNRPIVTDLRPAILDFGVPPNTAADDARVALARAVEPTAEFSALALDALIVWSADLEFKEELTAYVAQGQQNQIRLLAAAPRLNVPIALAEKLRADNAASTEVEAQPDTTDLDPTYNELLSKYKNLINQMSNEIKQLRDRMERRESVQRMLEKIRSGKDFAELQGKYEEARGRLMSLPELWRTRLRSNFLGQKPLYEEEERRIKNEINLINEQKKQHPWKEAFDKEMSYRLVLERLDAPLAAYSFKLIDLHEDINSLETAYGARGTSRAARGERCQQLRKAIGKAVDWLEKGTELSKEVENHMKGRDFPPTIRK